MDGGLELLLPLEEVPMPDVGQKPKCPGEELGRGPLLKGRETSGEGETKSRDLEGECLNKNERAKICAQPPVRLPHFPAEQGRRLRSPAEWLWGAELRLCQSWGAEEAKV